MKLRIDYYLIMGIAPPITKNDQRFIYRPDVKKRKIFLLSPFLLTYQISDQL